MATKSKNHIAIDLKRRLKIIENLVRKEPTLFISHTGEIKISEKAKIKLIEKKIDANELSDWLKIGVKHLKEASFFNLDTLMIQLPNNPNGSDVLVVLRDRGENKALILTRMEKEVLKNLVKGLSNKSIATNLSIGSGTVNAHLDNIYRKLDVSNRVSAICKAIKLGIVVPAS